MGEFDELARDLRDRVGHEIRAEAAEDETLTELGRRRRRDLAEAVREAMHRGDRITVKVADHLLVGDVRCVGGDYVTTETRDRVADVLLAKTTLSIEPRPAGGRSARPEAWTFRARLAEHEQNRSSIELILEDGERIRGVIEVVATDHLVVTIGPTGSRLVPVDLIAAVLSRPVLY